MSQHSENRVYSGASPEQVAADLAPLVDMQGDGLPLNRVEELIRRCLEPHLMRYDLPQFQSMFNAFPEPGAALGARLALGWNQGVTNWQVSPGGAMLEELCLQSLCRLFDLSEGAQGTLMYCGTYANQQALYMALHQYAEKRGFDLAKVGVRGFDNPSRLTVVVSADAHFSLRHAVRTLGLGEKSLTAVEVDANRRMDLEQLQKTVEELSRSRDVFCVVATAGTTATGSVDPIQGIADAAHELGAWLHIDGAYGLAYKLVPERTHLFTGLEQADSVSWDPHKQFSVPIPSSVLFARRPDDLSRMTLYSSYFNRPDSAEPNPGLKSMPSTRPLSALPLVASIRHQGLDGVVNRLRAPIEAITGAARYLADQHDMELCHDPDTGILCFRYIPRDLPAADVGALQQVIYERIMRSGERTISVTRLDGVTALRLVAVDPTVTLPALVETIEHVRLIGTQGG
jgi:glutamate/tyrosine decarboxylase-like PLP-dependent enzyme